VLLAIAGGSDLGLFEINESASLVQEAAHPEANIIFGTVIDDSLGDEVRVTVIAAGFDSGGPTHKKLDAQVIGSRTPIAPAQAGQVGQTTATPATPPRNAPPVATPAQGSTVYRPPTAPATQQAPANTYRPAPSGNGMTAPRVGVPTQPASGVLPGRVVPVTDDPDDEVDVPPFMRRT
jgi:cell division protein FtsZ